MSNYRPVGKKWSQFSPVTTTTGSASICLIDNGVNNTITLDNFFAQYPDLGSPNVAGDGVPVLEIAGSDYNIRSIESAGGIQVEIGPTNNILLSSSIENGSQGGVDVIQDDTATPQIVRTLKPGVGINIAADGEAIQISTTGTAPPTNVVSVYTVDDLPPPTGLVYELNDDTIYQQLDNIDFGNYTLELGDQTTYRGQSGLTTLIECSSTVPLFSIRDGARASINNIAVSHTNGTVFKTDNSVAQTGTLILSDIVINDCGTIAEINNQNILSMEVLSVVSTTVAGVIVSGSNLVINLDTILVSDWSGILFDMNGSTNSIMDIENATLVSQDPANIIIDGLPNSGNIVPNGLGTFRAVNVFGPFTYSANILPSDIRWNFTNVNPLQDSADLGCLFSKDNATATNVVGTNNPTQIIASFTEGLMSRFSGDIAGNLTYIGQSLISGVISVTTSAIQAGGGDDRYRILLYKNGDEIPGGTTTVSLNDGKWYGVTAQTPVEVTPGDVFNAWVEGIQAGDDVTVTDITLNFWNT